MRPHASSTARAMWTIALALALFTWTITPTTGAKEASWTVTALADTDGSLVESGGVTFAGDPAVGLTVGGYAFLSPAPSPVATMETTFTFHGLGGWDGGNELWLAGLVPVQRGTSGLALIWHRQDKGFFPSWELALSPVPDPIDNWGGSGDFASLPGYKSLRTITPIPGHSYKASLSVDAAVQQAAVSLTDLTEERLVYQGSIELSLPLPSGGAWLAPMVGGAATCLRCNPDRTEPWELTFHSATAAEDFVPFDASWRLVYKTPDGYQPRVTTFADQGQAVEAEVALPERPLPGVLSLVATGDGYRSVLADLSNVRGRGMTPLSLAELPAGPATLSLEYQTGTERWTLASRTLDIIAGEIDVAVVADRIAQDEWSGVLKVTSQDPLTSVHLQLNASIQVAGASGWQPIATHQFAFDDLTIGAEALTLPVRVPIHLSEPTVVRLVLSPPASTYPYRITISPREVEFLAMTTTPHAPERDYNFDGAISRETLTHYLSRAVTMLGLGDPGNPELLDDIRFIVNTGAKFIGRAAYIWNAPPDDDLHFQAAAHAAKLAHEADPDLILQACIFEAVYEGINQIPVPAWVFEEFGLPVEERNFSYEAMLFDDGLFVNHWSTNPAGSVPDMSKLETKMWFFYRAKRYIDAGYEAIHFGQVHLIGAKDPGFVHWQEILGRIRAYAKKHARRHMVIADAHTHGIVIDGRLLFDFHSYPLRIAEVPGQPYKGHLVAGRVDSIYNRSKSGISPSGWFADPMPYIVEVDNWGSSGRAGQSIGEYWVWGYDEISWFAHQDEAYRNEWLRYAWDWVRQTDPNGWLQMPAKRVLHDPVGVVGTYRAHTPSPANPHGFNQEETIKRIWQEDR